MTATRPGGQPAKGAGIDADVDVLIQRLDAAIPLPSYAHPGDAGADLCTTVDVEVKPGERALVPTGIAIALPAGYAAFVHPRSGLAHRLGVSIVNTPGTIDAGYRGEIKVILVNHDLREAAVFKRGDRIAQLIVQRVERAAFHEVAILPGSDRGAGGYGSTGGFAAHSQSFSGPPATVRGPRTRDTG